MASTPRSSAPPAGSGIFYISPRSCNWDRKRSCWRSPRSFRGRAHGRALAVALAWAMIGDAGWVLGKFPPQKPAAYGLGLLGVYATWLCVVVMLYPPYRRSASIKQRRNGWWWKLSVITRASGFRFILCGLDRQRRRRHVPGGHVAPRRPVEPRPPARRCAHHRRRRHAEARALSERRSALQVVVLTSFPRACRMTAAPERPQVIIVNDDDLHDDHHDDHHDGDDDDDDDRRKSWTRRRTRRIHRRGSRGSSHRGNQCSIPTGASAPSLVDNGPFPVSQCPGLPCPGPRACSRSLHWRLLSSPAPIPPLQASLRIYPYNSSSTSCFVQSPPQMH